MSDLPLVSIKIFVKDLSVEEIIGFNAYDEQSQKAIAEMLRNAQDESAFYRAIKYNKPFIFKLNGVKINLFEDQVRLRVPCGHFIILENVTDEILDILEMNREESIYVKAKAEKVITGKKKYLKATDVQFIIGSVDTDRAKELLNEYKPYELLALGFGYKQEPKAYGLLIPRLLPIFRPQNTALHVISFTPPDTGKSTFANLLERVWSAYFYTETPSLAQLVGDARYNSYGVAYYYRTLIFDEFDKLGSLERQKLEELWRVLQTGMEQGVWKRGVSSKGEISYRNTVSLLFFGNVTDEDLLNYTSQSLTTNHKDRLEYLIREKYKLNTKQFLDRIVYAEYLIQAPRTDEILNVQDAEVVYLDPKVTRGILKIIDEKCYNDFKRIETEKAGRKPRQINAFYTVLTHLGLELDRETIINLHNGSITFLDLFTSDKTVKSESKNTNESVKTDQPKDGKSDKSLDIKYEEWDLSGVVR